MFAVSQFVLLAGRATDCRAPAEQSVIPAPPGDNEPKTDKTRGEENDSKREREREKLSAMRQNAMPRRLSRGIRIAAVVTGHSPMSR